MPADDPRAQLAAVIRELRRIAESPLPPLDKLGLLCAQIGTAVYWLEQMNEAAERVHGPHWRDARSWSDLRNVSTNEREQRGNADVAIFGNSKPITTSTYRTQE